MLVRRACLFLFHNQQLRWQPFCCPYEVEAVLQALQLELNLAGILHSYGAHYPAQAVEEFHISGEIGGELYGDDLGGGVGEEAGCGGRKPFYR